MPCWHTFISGSDCLHNMSHSNIFLCWFVHVLLSSDWSTDFASVDRTYISPFDAAKLAAIFATFKSAVESTVFTSLVAAIISAFI